MRLFWNTLAWASITIISIAALLLIYWQIQPTTVLTAKQPFKVVEVRDRILVYLSANYCKKIKATGTVRTSFVGKTIEVFSPMATESMPTGCHTDQQIPVLIPDDLPSGTYYIKFNATYKVSPIHNFNLVITSEKFEVK